VRAANDADDDIDARLRVGLAAAKAAGDLARRYFTRRAGLVIETKGPQDLVSVADRAVETAIRDAIAAAFPADAMVGEEHGGDATATGWVIDPIDGTQNFLRGIPQFVVSIAYRRDGVTELGVIRDPNAGETFAARRGGGATRNGAPIRVSGVVGLEQAVLGVGHSPRHPAGRYVEAVAAAVAAGAQTRNYCCAALQLAYVADGRLDATWDPYLLDWDVAAGILIVEEAGGMAAPFQPGRLGPAADRLVAGNAPLVRRLLPLLP